MYTMEKYRHVIEAVRKDTNYLTKIENGVHPDEVLREAIATLSKYTKTPISSESVPLPIIAFEAAAVEILVNTSDWGKQLLSEVMWEYSSARSINPQASVDAISKLNSEMLKSESEFYSLALLEHPKDSLSNEELRVEIFRNIGDLIESSIKPLLRGLLCQVRIRRNRDFSFETVRKLSLGNVVQELSDTLRMPALVAPPPFCIRLNHWRNIAKHHDSYCEGKTVVCEYLEGGSTQTVRLAREDLFNLMSRTMELLTALRVGRSLTVVEYLNETKFVGNEITFSDVRPEIVLLQFATGLACLGFETVDFSVSSSSVRLKLKDVVPNSPYRDRMLISAQTIYPLWSIFPRELLEVTYLDCKNREFLTSKTTGQDCIKVKEGAITLSELLSSIDFCFPAD